MNTLKLAVALTLMVWLEFAAAQTHYNSAVIMAEQQIIKNMVGGDKEPVIMVTVFDDSGTSVIVELFIKPAKTPTGFTVHGIALQTKDSTGITQEAIRDDDLNGSPDFYGKMLDLKSNETPEQALQRLLSLTAKLTKNLKRRRSSSKEGYVPTTL